MKIKSQRAENETFKVSIGKNKFELDHSNSEIEAKEEEKKLLNEQIQKKEFRIKDIEKKLIEYNESFPELEKQKTTYDELLIKYKMQLTEKQQDMIDIESRIQELNDTVESLQEQIDGKENLIEVNEKRIEDMKREIDISNNEHKERQERIASISEKQEHLNEEYEKLLKAKEVIDSSINDSRTIFQKLKVQLDSQEKEIRNKESRIHRLEMLSLIYRASKFFGGILIGLGIIFLIWGIGSLTFIDLGDANIPVLSGLMIFGAILAIQEYSI